MQMTPYGVDFCKWTAETASLLRQGRWSETDVKHIASEIENLGKQISREIQSYLIRIMELLLRLQSTDDPLRTKLWQSAMVHHRIQMKLLLADSPSLHRKLRGMMPAAYRSAVRITKPMVTKPLPAECPFTLEQLMTDRPKGQWESVRHAQRKAK